MKQNNHTPHTQAEIARLTECYWQGLTDLTEESRLAVLLDQQPQAQLTAEARCLRLMLGQAHAHRQVQAAPMQQPKRLRAGYRRLVLYISSVAAAVALVLVVRWYVMPTPPSPVIYGVQAGELLHSQQEAMLLVDQALGNVAYDPLENQIGNLDW